MSISFVTSSSDSGPGSLRDAVLRSSKIIICPEVTIITLNSEIKISTNLVIVGNTLITSTSGRIFFITSPAISVKFKGLSLSGGSTPQNGGAIYVESPSTSLILKKVVISNNRAEKTGGGIFTMGPLYLFETSVISNSAGVQGGGIWGGTSTLLLRSKVCGNTITSLSEGSGGSGIFIDDGDIVVDNSQIINNSVLPTNPTASGGGIVIMSGSIYLQNSIVKGNSAFNAGGVQGGIGSIYLIESEISENSSFNSSHAAGGGGGIVAVLGDVYSTRSIISNNITQGMYSAGIVSLIGNTVIDKSEISGNINRGPGGGIAMNFGNVTITQSNIRKNTGASLGGGIVTFAPAPAALSITETDISDNILTDDETIRQTIEAFLEVISGSLSQMSLQAKISGTGGQKFLAKVPEILKILSSIPFPPVSAPGALSDLRELGNSIAGGGVACLLPSVFISSTSRIKNNRFEATTKSHGDGIFSLTATTSLFNTEVEGIWSDSKLTGIESKIDRFFNGPKGIATFIRCVVREVENLGNITSVK